MKKCIIKAILFLILVTTGGHLYAAWHYGIVKMVSVGYDGKTIVVNLDSFSRKNCTCYPTWPGYFCLDDTRQSAEKELAIILAAKVASTRVAVNIDEESCKIRALVTN